MVWKPHATVAVVVPHGDAFLVVKEHSEGAVVLNQPAGHIEENESVFEAACREALEETGYRVELTGFLGLYIFRSPRNGATYHRYAFIGEAVEKVSEELDEGIIEPHWLTEGQLVESEAMLRSPLVLECVRDYKSGRRLPLDTIREF